MSSFQPIVIILLFVALAVAGGIVGSNWLAARKIAQEAERRGWRYIMPKWIGWSRPTINIAGHTENGAIWELRRIKSARQIQYSWRTYSAPLPYGSIQILPTGVDSSAGDQKIKLREVCPNHAPWPAEFSLYTSHDQLANLIGPDLTDAMCRFPPHPQKGALAMIRWEDGVLTITCFYEEGWEVIDRLVAFGEAFLKQAEGDLSVT